jgi:hypothetical protein
VAILNENPEFYLDEIGDAYFKQPKILLHSSTIWRKLLHKLMKQGYHLKIYSERAKQQNEADRAAYMKEIHLLVRNPNQVLLIGEMHKDKRSSRRSRAWGTVGHDVVVDKCFHDATRYTMMGVADVNGFVQSACVCFRRDELFDDPQGGTSGTVNTQEFIDWLTLKILPLLGNFEKGEPHSIIILDNASIHMAEEIVSLIQSKRAYILYTAAFSPDINPIDTMFVIYKACVKRNQALMASNSCYDLHLFALGTITPDIALSEFKKCGLPIKDLNTVKEKQEIIVALAIILTMLNVAVIIEKTAYINSFHLQA